ALEAAERSWGRCSIPLYGIKGSLNVAVAAGILLAGWTSSIVSQGGGKGEEKDAVTERQRLLDLLTTGLASGH
ncbi:MAG: hypothetical protein ACOC47_09780, partial [Alkalispirochaetaceae bacterium]